MASEKEQQKLIIKPKHPKGEDGYKVFSVRIKEGLVDEIEKIAGQTGHSRNELIGMFIEFGLENCEIESL